MAIIFFPADYVQTYVVESIFIKIEPPAGLCWRTHLPLNKYSLQSYREKRMGSQATLLHSQPA